MSEVERVERLVDDAMSAHPRDYAQCVAALERAVALVRADPDARTSLSLAELLDDLATAYGNLGRFTEAVGDHAGGR